MVLPSKEVIQGIRHLINEVTGYGEDEENFYICEQYCLSHVMHDTYPSVNKHEVKKLIDGLVLRFFIHGSFKVADGLETEVNKFLGNDVLFKTNPQFDIQWVLLSLITALASNLTEVRKLPKMITADDDEKPFEEINWGAYLMEGLPNYDCYDSDSSSSNISLTSQSSSKSQSDGEELKKSVEQVPVTDEKNVASLVQESCNNKSLHASRQHIIDDLVKRRKEEISYTRDVILRGNFIAELDNLTNGRITWDRLEILSEFEMVGYILKQFLSGENVFRKKGITNPATCSLTEDAVKSFLSSFQPYVDMMTIFQEFCNDVVRLENININLSSEKSLNLLKSNHERGGTAFKSLNTNNKTKGESRTVPNVVKLYNLALRGALHSFENKILTLSEYQSSYTLLKTLHELRPSFNDLSSLFAVHLTATTNWLNEPNWLCSVKIIMTLYNAILNSTSNRMGFLFMNMFLHCFQAYLDITDNWISSLSLNDPHDEYIIFRVEESVTCASSRYRYSIRPYKDELNKVGLRDIKILDYLANKMIHVGHSIDILQRLDRSFFKNQNETNLALNKQSLYLMLLEKVKQELIDLGEISPTPSEAYRDFNLSGQMESISESSVVDTCDQENCQNELYESNSNNNNTTNNNVINTEKLLNKNGLRDLLLKDFIDGHTVAKHIALSDFCIKLCKNAKENEIEKIIWPLGVVLEKNIVSLLNARVLNTCDLAKDVVVNEFQLKIHLRLFRNIFLFNDPYLIQPFMNILFNQESLWQNSYVLSVQLRECVKSSYKDQARYLSVSVEEDVLGPPENILEAIDSIRINYQVHWPLQLIFTPRVMSLYNDIFRHLFKLHWAHQSLCKLQFTDIKNDAYEVVKSSSRRLELLRFWCLSSVARLRSYFMAQISNTFDLELNSYQHLKHIITAHEAFIEKIHARCLLDDSTKDGKDLIFSILIPLCHDVYRFWCTGHVIPDSKLTLVENLFFSSQKQFPWLMAMLEQD